MPMIYKRRNSSKLSMRNSVIIWVGGAFLGWALMVVTVYNVLRFPDTQIAEDGQATPAAIALDERSLNEIAPAAGSSVAPVDNTLAEDLDEEKDQEEDDDEDKSENVDDKADRADLN